jgi:hypothetical protein
VRPFRALACALCAPLVALAAAAGTAPKPSQLVTAYTVGIACTGIPEGSRFNTMRTLATAEGAFAIPPKQVLVITHVELRTAGADPNEDLSLYLLSPPAGLLYEARARASAVGEAFVSLDLPSGVAVRSGAELCASTSDGSALGLVTGYFAKDR